MPNPTPPPLNVDNLMAHMRVLCKQIGPRPATSDAERRAAEYVKQTLTRFGWPDFQEQPFRSYSTMGWVTMPAMLITMLALALGLSGGFWGKLVAGILFWLGCYTYYCLFRVRPPWFEALVARGRSQNVIVTAPPAGAIQRTLFLVGHLDSNKQRFMTPPPWPAMMKPMATFIQFVMIVAGLLFVVSAFIAPLTPSWLWIISWFTLALLLTNLPLAILDELQPYIEGANDNATAVSVLLGVAEALKTNPLQNTAVTLLFTGCEEIGCLGIENYLRQFKPPKENTFWIDLEMVGTANLAYVTQHGVSYLSQYRPSPGMLELAAKTAGQYPELKVNPKDMLIVEEVSNLRHWGYQAICLAGYNDQGWLPNWHRVSDRLENIEPDTLSRAAQYTWRLMQTIDAM